MWKFNQSAQEFLHTFIIISLPHRRMTERPDDIIASSAASTITTGGDQVTIIDVEKPLTHLVNKGLMILPLFAVVVLVLSAISNSTKQRTSAFAAI